MGLVKVFRRYASLLMVLIIAASVAFNASMLMVSGVYTAASAALSGIGVTTAAAREAVARRVARENTRKIARQTAKNVTRRAQRGAVRSITSVGGKAIPVMGVAVLTGVLALEVNDACETAADMAGLNAALDADDDPDLARQNAVDAFDCQKMIREELPDYTDLPSRDVLWADIRGSPEAAWNSAKKYMPDLPDFSESYASGLARVTVWACMVLPCGTGKVIPE